MDSKTILARIKADDVKFISLQFTDVTGAVKSVDIPASRVSDALEDGIWFDGSSVEGFARIQESDMRLILDPNTYAVLPWTRQELRRARIFCDIYTPNGEPFAGDRAGHSAGCLRKLKPAAGYTISVPSQNFSCSRRAKMVIRTPSRMMSVDILTSLPATKPSASALS